MIIKDPLHDWIGIINEILQVTNRKLLVLTNTCLKVRFSLVFIKQMKIYNHVIQISSRSIIPFNIKLHNYQIAKVKFK